MKIGGD